MKHWNKVRCYMLEWHKEWPKSQKGTEVHGGSDECKLGRSVKASRSTAWSSGVWTHFGWAERKGMTHRWRAGRPLCPAFILLLSDATFLHLCQCWSWHNPQPRFLSDSPYFIWHQSKLQIARCLRTHYHQLHGDESEARDWHEDQRSSSISSLVVTLMFI